MDFSKALVNLRDWRKITREWWNWKWMFLELQTPDEHSKMTLPYIYMNIPKCDCKWKSKACNNCWKYNRVPWLASQTDLLVDDWDIL